MRGLLILSTDLFSSGFIALVLGILLLQLFFSFGFKVVFGSHEKAYVCFEWTVSLGREACAGGDTAGWGGGANTNFFWGGGSRWVGG